MDVSVDVVDDFELSLSSLGILNMSSIFLRSLLFSFLIEPGSGISSKSGGWVNGSFFFY